MQALMATFYDTLIFVMVNIQHQPSSGVLLLLMQHAFEVCLKCTSLYIQISFILKQNRGARKRIIIVFYSSYSLQLQDSLLIFAMRSHIYLTSPY